MLTKRCRLECNFESQGWEVQDTSIDGIDRLKDWSKTAVHTFTLTNSGHKPEKHGRGRDMTIILYYLSIFLAQPA